jgi:hypothetical protein
VPDGVVDRSTVHPFTFGPNGFEEFFARKNTVGIVDKKL